MGWIVVQYSTFSFVAFGLLLFISNQRLSCAFVLLHFVLISEFQSLSTFIHSLIHLSYQSKHVICVNYLEVKNAMSRYRMPARIGSA